MFICYRPGADAPAQKIFRLSRRGNRNVMASGSLCRDIYQKDSWYKTALFSSPDATKGTLKMFLNN